MVYKQFLLIVCACVLQFCRWTLLITGIAYGAYFQRKFRKIEDARRAEELRLKPIRDAQLAEEKRLQNLGKIFYYKRISKKYIYIFCRLLFNITLNVCLMFCIYI